MCKNYGYVRVSTKEQNEARQMIALANINVELTEIFMDKQKGKEGRHSGDRYAPSGYQS